MQRDAEEEFQRLMDHIVDIEFVQHAGELVQLRVEPRTWEMFRTVIFENIAVKDVAVRFGLTDNGVYRAVYRTKKVFAEIIQKLEDGEKLEGSGR